MGRKKRSDKDELADLIYQELTDRNEYAQQRSKLEAEKGQKVFFLHGEAFEAVRQPQTFEHDASSVSSDSPLELSLLPADKPAIQSSSADSLLATDTGPQSSTPGLPRLPLTPVVSPPPGTTEPPRTPRSRSKPKLTFRPNQDWQLFLSHQQFKILEFLLSFESEEVPLTGAIIMEATGVPQQTLTRTLAIFRAKKLIRRIEKRYPGGNKHSVVHLNMKLCQKSFETNAHLYK